MSLTGGLLAWGRGTGKSASGGGVGCAPDRLVCVVGLLGASPEIQFVSVQVRDRRGKGEGLQSALYHKLCGVL